MAASVPDVAAAARVVVLTREGCHLCDQALTAVRQLCDDLGVSWTAVDVDSSAQLREEFTDHVPVTFVDGRLWSRWFVDLPALRDLLI